MVELLKSQIGLEGGSERNADSGAIPVRDFHSS
jgi:hypothetical protein